MVVSRTSPQKVWGDGMLEDGAKAEMEEKSNLYKIRHSLAHVMAQAVQRKFPGVKLGFGPPVEHGFYYDFDFGDQPVSESDLKDIEKEMRRIIGEKQRFVRAEANSADDAFRILAERMPGQSFKVEHVGNLSAGGETQFSFYTNGPFTDLCAGPHVEDTGQLPRDAFKLDSIAGAYWLGSEKNAMLTRIYGLAFETRKDLDDLLARREIARANDHKKLGRELEIFTLSDLVGKGLILWLPYGAVICEEIEKFAKETEFKYGYQRVRSPQIAKRELFETSQHIPAYLDSMYPPMQIKEEDGTSVSEFYLKPMNCPHHHVIYSSSPRSYRELPLRLAEYGTCYRYEQSGEVSGLIRVRCMTMNDAHIYLRHEQLRDELKSVLKMYFEMYDVFGLSEYVLRLSLRGPANHEKYKGTDEMWRKAESILAAVLDEEKVDYVVAEGEAAFYGPKIDIQFRNLLGREETVSTIQVDFLAAMNFDLHYTDENGQPQPVVVIHRAPLSTHERFVSYLIEYYGGAFPTWCAPVQVAVIPVADEFADYARAVAARLRSRFVRVEVDLSNNSFSKKIRTNTVRKIPNLLIVGNRERETGSVTLRRYGIEKQESMPLDRFLEMILDEIQGRVMLREPMGALL